MTPWFLVTVDTEEEGLWRGRYAAEGNSVRNIEQVPLFQQLCDHWGVRPTYLVDAPVVEDKTAVAILRRIAEQERCEIGAHVHPWCNPPLTEFSGPRDSYLCNLPAELQREKIAWLTERIADRFGRRPTSFRAGRYGLDDTGARLLIEFGYTVDSSVIPFTDYSHDGGPNFTDAPYQPYRIDSELCQPSASGPLLELPVSVGYNWRDFRRADRWFRLCQDGIRRQMHLEGLLNRLGMLQRIKLSPEQATAAQMNVLVDRLLEQGSRAVVLMFHSSSLLPGASPYVRNESELQEFWRRLEQTFRHCVHRRGMRTGTLREFESALRAVSVPLSAVR